MCYRCNIVYISCTRKNRINQGNIFFITIYLIFIYPFIFKEVTEPLKVQYKKICQGKVADINKYIYPITFNGYNIIKN